MSGGLGDFKVDYTDPATAKAKHVGKELSEQDKAAFVACLLQGMTTTEARSTIRRRMETIYYSRQLDPTFNEQCIAAIKQGNVENVVQKLVELASGQCESVVEKYVLVCDKHGEPVLDNNGKQQVRLASRVVRRGKPSLAAQKYYLQANSIEYKAGTNDDPVVRETVIVDPKIIEALILDKAKNIK